MTRKDLSAGMQLVQSCHAIRDFEQKIKGFEEVPNLVCLAAEDEGDLDSLSFILSCYEPPVKHVVFREPDIGDQITAIAIQPGPKVKKLLSSLPLALSNE